MRPQGRSHTGSTILPRLHLGILIAVALAGCTSASTRTQTSIVTPMPEMTPLLMDDVVVTEREPMTADVVPEERRVSISARDADVRSVLLTLAQQVDINVVVDPDVDGKVTIDVSGVTFEDALEAIIAPFGYHYRVNDDLLRVYGDDYQTRIFTLDYITGARTGRTRLSASSGGSSGSTTGNSSSSGQQGSGGENLVSVESVITSDLWHEIVSGLEMIVFGGGQGSAETVGAAGGQDPYDPNAGHGGSLFERRSPDEGSSASASVSDSGKKTRPRLVIHPQSGTVLVTASFETLNRVADFLERIQGAAHRQVVIEARIVEVTLTDGYTLGIDWSRIPGMGDVRTVFGEDDAAASQTLAPSDGIFELAFSEGDFDLLLGALANQGDVKVISAPRVAALNNQKAVFKAAREQSFFARRIDFETQPDGTSQPILTVDPERVTIGLVLDVTPQISAVGDIMMSIHPSITELTGEDVFPPGASGDDILANAPVLDIREVDTVVRVETGQMLVIGGLMKERISETKKMVPFLGKIPILGHLFSQTVYSKEHIELVIALRPIVVVGNRATELAMRDLQRLGRMF